MRWVSIPVAELLYRVDRAGHAWSQVGAGYGALFSSDGAIGSVYVSADGSLYGTENIGGKIYKFSLDGVTANFVAQGSVGGIGDGARCASFVPVPP